MSMFSMLLQTGAAVLFILSLKWMSDVKRSRSGNYAGAIGMGVAVVATLLAHPVEDWHWVVLAVIAGSAIGVPMALKMPMTAVPQRTAVSHAFGALAAALVGVAEYYQHAPHVPGFTMSVLGAEMILGFLTFTGSVIAFAKLQEIIPGSPLVYPGKNLVSLVVFAIAASCAIALVFDPSQTWLLHVLIGASLVFGFLLVMGIGGADMPTVIAILNAYAGLSAAALGFVLNNKVLIVAGSLDGSSGLILAILMCKAMNRSFLNVLFGGFGAVSETSGDDVYAGKIKSAQAKDIALLLSDANRVVIVPGYGMAVSQAQHAVRELTDLLESRGTEVRFAIHPVAGRMPGHMNVLLAEADVSYDKLMEMEEVNPLFPETDIAVVLGANDVVNPLARTDPKSPIAGMPILDVYKARTVVVMKRSLSPGFAGIPNPLFSADNTLMYFADGKRGVLDVVNAIKEGA